MTNIVSVGLRLRFQTSINADEGGGGFYSFQRRKKRGVLDSLRRLASPIRRFFGGLAARRGRRLFGSREGRRRGRGNPRDYYFPAELQQQPYFRSDADPYAGGGGGAGQVRVDFP